MNNLEDLCVQLYKLGITEATLAGPGIETLNKKLQEVSYVYVTQDEKPAKVISSYKYPGVTLHFKHE